MEVSSLPGSSSDSAEKPFDKRIRESSGPLVVQRGDLFPL